MSRFGFARGVIVVVGAVVALTVPAAALADGVYHSQHFELRPVGGATLNEGFLENIHANGNIYAHEEYHLVGVSPSTTYYGTLEFFLFDPTCSVSPIDVPTAVLTTNTSGNGTADKVFLASDIPSILHNTTNGEVFVFRTADGTIVYTTDCTSGMFD
jgi:hypothetical protein